MKKIICFLFALTITGCAQFNASNNETASNLKAISWSQHQQQLQQLNNWSLTGKLAIFTENNRQSANIYWQQTNDDYSIQLTSLFGTRILQITKNEDGIEIINNDDDIFTGKDVNQLVQQLSPGLDLPIVALQQWIKGNPINASYQLNEQQQVNYLLGQDAGGSLWTVNYQHYQTYSGYALPNRVDLKQNNMRLKIVINQWQIRSH